MMQQQQQQQQKHICTATTTTIKKEYLNLGQSLAIAPILPLACGYDGYSFIVDFEFEFAFLHHPMKGSNHSYLHFPPPL